MQYRNSVGRRDGLFSAHSCFVQGVVDALDNVFNESVSDTFPPHFDGGVKEVKSGR